MRRRRERDLRDEGTWTLMLMEGPVRRWGIPLALYSNRHGVLKFSGRPPHTAAHRIQAKDRVERMAGIFQDRLVTELRLADAATIGRADEVLPQFLPRLNAQFGVPAEQPDVAYRPMDPSLSLADVLCFKHSRRVTWDNTAHYQWRTLQLLPGEDRPGYAGAPVEVLELPDGRLRVRHRGKTVPAREAPRSPGELRACHGRMTATPELDRIVIRLV